MIAFGPLTPGVHKEQPLVAIQRIDGGLDHRPEPAFIELWRS